MLMQQDVLKSIIYTQLVRNLSYYEHEALGVAHFESAI